MFAQIASVVKYLNDMGICHRECTLAFPKPVLMCDCISGDIKDENIVVDKNLCVKLIDFGSAILFDVRKPVPYHTRFYGVSAHLCSDVACLTCSVTDRQLRICGNSAWSAVPLA